MPHYLREVCDMALAHNERDQTEDANSRSPVMGDWADHLCNEKPDAELETLRSHSELYNGCFALLKSSNIITYI